jgi:hypothetical protein
LAQLQAQTEIEAETVDKFQSELVKAEEDAAQLKEEQEAEAARIKAAEEAKLKTTAQATKISVVSCVDGQKEYATTSFLTGEFADNPNLWKVHFGEDNLATLRLADLPGTEIYVGGDFFAKFGDEVVDGFVDENDKAQAVLCIDERVCVTLSLRGIPDQDMENLKAARSTDMFKVLMSVAERNNCEAEFVVETMEFFTASIPGLMSHLKMDPAAEKQRLEALEVYAFLGDIISLMQMNGTKVIGQELVDRAKDIMDYLIEASWKRTDAGLDKIIASLVAAERLNMFISMEECKFLSLDVC